MHIYFVRHGQSEANAKDIISNRTLNVHGLTDIGREQARAVAEQLTTRVENVIDVYASPLLRARQTGGIIAERLGLSSDHVLVTNALIERDPGIMEGKTDPQSWEVYMDLARLWREGDYCARLPEGESYHDVRARFMPFIDHIKHKHRDQDGAIVMVGHAGTYLMMLPLILANIDSSYNGRRELDNCQFVLAEQRGDDLVCVEWAGKPIL
ncbi:MAG: histidine phosphatase family protein [Anaerolineae bacterium]|nr:histidine phosphatase family protein [Anaerolineae bacterium]